MNDDGLDGIVIGKLLELGDDLLGRENYAIEFNHANLGPEAGKRFFIPAAETQVHQRKHTHHEQRKQPAAHQQPNPNARTPFSHNQTSVAPEVSQGKRSDCRVLTYSRSELEKRELDFSTSAMTSRNSGFTSAI